ncbi:MAG: hypothetical protein ACOYK9_01245 [Chlamydiia bacterium]
MKHFFLTLLSLLLLLVIGSYLLFTFRVHVINSSLSTSFSVPVRISALDFSKKLVSIKNLEIYNPPKSIAPKALSMKSIQIHAPLRRYFEVNTDIHSVEINDIEVEIEFYDQQEKEMNWNSILGSSWESTNTPIDADAAVVTIRTFTINNLKVTLRTPNQEPRIFYVQGPVTYKNLNSRRGIPGTVIADMIVRITLMEVFSIEGLAHFAGSLFEHTLSPFEKLIELPFGPRKPLQ